MTERDAYPSLTGLRFVLAAWITVYHLISAYGPATLAESPLIEVGNSRVDIFFVLSGFVLAHVYAVRPQALKKGFDFPRFLVARAARLYPLHLLGLSILVVSVVGAHAIGRSEQVADFTVQGLLANVFMLQAVGIPGSGVWNFPAWTLSAEAFGYLLFPLFLMVGAAMANRSVLFWGFALAVVCVIGLFWPLLGTGALTDATQVLGIVRGALCMFVGVAARYAFSAVTFNRTQGALLAFAGAAIAGASAVMSLDLWLVAAGASGLIFGLAALDTRGGTPLAHPVMETLGRWSYGLFVLHMPIFMVLTNAMTVAGWDGELTWAIGIGLFAVALAAGWLAHVFVEEPARKWIRSRYDEASPRLPTALKTL